MGLLKTGFEDFFTFSISGPLNVVKIGYLCKILGKRMGHFQKLAINKKSTIFVQSSWNLVKMITSWANHFHQVSWVLDKKCGFFTNDQFLNVSRFLFPRLYDDLCSKTHLFQTLFLDFKLWWLPISRSVEVGKRYLPQKKAL